MKFICAPSEFDFDAYAGSPVILYGQPESSLQGSGGAKIATVVRRRSLRPSRRAWDLLSIAMSAVAADLGAHRRVSPDGWTRDLTLTVAVDDADFWQSQSILIENMLRFLTTDRWSFEFVAGGRIPAPPRKITWPKQDSVLLLSGGLDSLIGAIDVAVDSDPFAVSHTVRGNSDDQARFASSIGLNHIQLNHAIRVPESESPPGQRARSIAFLAYGVLVATCLSRYEKGSAVDLFVCENGFISINPPLTDLRLGSLSTRTTHPFYLGEFQRLLEAADLKVKIKTPYQFKTKGQMLEECRDPTYIANVASRSTSCGRFNHYGNQHCGRCLPCIIRRAAFNRAGIEDNTKYKYVDIGADNDSCIRFDDVRSSAMAVIEASDVGIDRWLGSSLDAIPASDLTQYRDIAERGLAEIELFLKARSVL